MTIPSIKMMEASVVDGASAAGASEPGGGVASFASFLGDEANGASTGQAPLPRAEVPQIVRVPKLVDQGVTPKTESASSETTMVVDANLAAPVVSFRPLATPGLENTATQGEVMDSNEVGAKLGESAKGRMGAAGPKAVEKRPQVDAAAGQISAVTSSLPVSVLAPVVSVGEAVPSVPDPALQAEGSFGLASALSGEGRPMEGESVERRAAVGDEVALPVVDSEKSVTRERMTDANEVVDAGAVTGDAAGQQWSVLPMVPMLPTKDDPTLTASPLQTIQPDMPALRGALPSIAPPETGGTSLQKNTHALPAAADKSSIPAGPTAATIGLLSAADPARGIANQHPFYAASGIHQDTSLTNDRGIKSGTVEEDVPSAGSERGTAKQELDVARGTSTSASGQRHDGAGLPNAVGFGLTFSSETGQSDTGNSLAKDVVRSSTVSPFEQIAMERMQTAGATRALGDALQSTMGLGVQTESFGRVTIHTATEGNHLLAQVTLEDGRQSATLVSHVPGVEQKLTQQFGMEAAVRVSTESQSSQSGSMYGDTGRDTRQQRNDTGETKTAKAGQGLVTGLQTGEERVPSSWGQSSSSGRLDVTV